MKDAISTPPTPADLRRGRLIGVLFGIAVMGLGLLAMVPVWFDPAAALAPLWVIELAGGAFLVAGLSLICETLGWRAAARVFSALLIPALGLIAVWALLLDRMGGTCSIGAGLFGVSVGGALPDWPCQAMMAGAIGLSVLTVALGLIGLWRRRKANQTG